MVGLFHVGRVYGERDRLSNFGVQALIREDVELAEEFFHEAIDLKPQNAVAHSNLAVLYWKNDQTDKARQHFHRALDENPNFESARERLERMNKEIAVSQPKKTLE